MALVAGIDSSTQSCKVVICDADSGELVRSAASQHPDGTEVDPQRWWDALQAGIDAAGGVDDVQAVSVGPSNTAWCASTKPALWFEMRCCGTTPDRVRPPGSSSTSWADLANGRSGSVWYRSRPSRRPSCGGLPTTSPRMPMQPRLCAYRMTG